MKITAYLDVLSLWCLYAERSLDRVLEAHGSRIAFDWRLSLIRGEEPLGYSREQERWFYRRGTSLTGISLNPDWMEGPQTGTAIPNFVAEAARSLGCTDRRARRALMEAAMVDGRPIWKPEVAIEVVVAATQLDGEALHERMDDTAVRDRVRADTARMLALGVTQRPTFVFENVIPDRAILSGVWAYEPLAALAEAMLRDEERFVAFNEANPPPQQ